MENTEHKFNLPVITAEEFESSSSDRFELRKGSTPDAPPCPFGHRFKWIGYDKDEKKYVRVTKSVFKKLIARLDQDFVEAHEFEFEEKKREM